MKYQKKTVNRILRLLKKDRALLLLSLLFALLSVVGSLTIPLLSGRAIDFIVGAGNVNFSKVQFYALWIAGAVLATAIAQWLMNVINHRLTYSLVSNLRNEAFRKIQRLPVSYLDSHSVGDTLSRIMSDVDQFTDGILMGFNQFFTGVLTILGTLGVMLSIQPKVALVVIFLTPLSVFFSAQIAKFSFRFFKVQSKLRSEQTALIDEGIGEHKIIRSFGREPEMQQKFDESNERLRNASLKAVFFSSITNPTTRFLNNLIYAGVALIGAFFCISGAGISVGLLTAFLSYATQYTKPFNEISGVVAELQNALSCAERLFELMDVAPVPQDVPDAVELKVADGRVQLEEVAFSYTPEKELIKNLNLSVTPGQKIAIVGPTGCGKTTLINLLMRFYDVDAGSIKVSGFDLRDIQRRSLRKNWGMVLQETWLHSGSIRENIAFGKPDATDGEIISAAKSAHADSFIRRLPEGYDTKLGEGGGTLSQGQKQLLCIARVMLSLPPMLILDEATSSIDTRMELKIRDAFALLMEGRTSFIVAHRLSTVENSDLILVMKDGKIIEQGKHRDLLEKGGFYASLYQSQFTNNEIIT